MSTGSQSGREVNYSLFRDGWIQGDVFRKSLTGITFRPYDLLVTVNHKKIHELYL